MLSILLLYYLPSSFTTTTPVSTIPLSLYRRPMLSITKTAAPAVRGFVPATETAGRGRYRRGQGPNWKPVRIRLDRFLEAAQTAARLVGMFNIEGH